MSDYRIETDSMGEVKVENQYYWGAQTQRSINNFKIAAQKMPQEVIRALTIIKRSAAIVHTNLGVLNKELADTIVYSSLQRKSLISAVLLSACSGLIIDSLIFLHIAFRSYQYITGQIVGKLLMVLLAIPFIYLMRNRNRNFTS